MLNAFIHSSLPWRTLFSRLKNPTLGLGLALGVMAAGLPQSATYSAEVRSQSNPPQANQMAAQATDSQVISDGVYLYGQSSEPEQIGSAYMVFEVDQNQVVGAFYMPHSSFDCFYGDVASDRLALTVVDSYEQSLHPYSVALEPNSSVAGSAIAPMGIEGFHQISSISENDQRILAACQADYQQRQ